MSERQDIVQESVGGLHDLPLDTRQTVFIQPEPKVTPAETFALGVGTLAVIEARRAQLEKIESRQRALFEDIVTHQEIRPEWRSLSHWSSDLGAAAHYADLSVIAHSERNDEASPSGLVESLILTSGRPVVLFTLNGTVSRIRRILVGWNASREAVRAVADALPLLVRAEAIEVLAVDPERYRNHGQEPGAEIARHLARHGAKVKCTTGVFWRRRYWACAAVAGCQFRCRSLGDRRLWPLQVKGGGFRWCHADDATGSGASRTDVSVTYPVVSSVIGLTRNERKREHVKCNDNSQNRYDQWIEPENCEKVEHENTRTWKQRT